MCVMNLYMCTGPLSHINFVTELTKVTKLTTLTSVGQSPKELVSLNKRWTVLRVVYTFDILILML